MGETPEVLGPYVIYERLGAGGMATVHRAEHVGVEGFRRAIALKRLLPHVAAEPAMLEMFIHEARLASQLKHANVAATYDLGKVDDTYFIAMEYVPGPTLTQIMRQCGTVVGPMPVPIVLAIMQQLLDALDHAHNLSDDMGRALGIIHRDISPSNIIVSTAGLVKLIDFGIAKAATGGVQTQTGMIKGKYAYIAPEYMQGHLDSRADLFGAGIIAHELLSTKRLFNAASDYETLLRLRELPIVPPSRVNADVPPDLDDIVLTALQRDPDQRWQSASAMRTALTNVARTMKDGLVSNQQLTDWVEWAFAQSPRNQPVMSTGLARVIDTLDDAGDGDDDQTRARHVERSASASDVVDPTIPPPAPASRARTRLARVTAEPPMDPYETMTGAKMWPTEKPRSNPNIVRRTGQIDTPTPEPTQPVKARALSEEETPAPELAARAKMLASRTADLAAAHRSAQFAAETVVRETDATSLDEGADTSEQTADATGDLTINRVFEPAKISGLTPASRDTPSRQPRKRRLDASEYEIEMERTDESVAQPLPPAPPRRSARPETPEPVRTSPPRSSEQSLDQALGSLEATLPPQRDSPMPLGSPPTPPPRNAGSPASAPPFGGASSQNAPFGGPPPMPPGSAPLPPHAQTSVINPSGGSPSRGSAPSQAPPFGGAPSQPPNAFAATHPSQPPPGVFPPAQSAANAFAPVAPTLMVAPVLSPASVINPSAPVINPSAPYDPNANRGSKPPSQVINRGTPSQPPPMGAPHVSAPQMGAPHVSAPQMGAPHVSAPQMGAPHVSAPQMGAPHVSAPQMGAPHVSAPQMGAPPMGAPPMDAPHVSAPHVSAPQMGAPHVSAPHVSASPHAATQVINPSAPFTSHRPGPSQPPPRPSPSQSPSLRPSPSQPPPRSGPSQSPPVRPSPSQPPLRSGPSHPPPLRPSPSQPPLRPGPSQPPPFGANRLVVPTAMPLGGPSSGVAERAALIPSLPQRPPPPPVLAARPSAPNAKTLVVSTTPVAPTAASASTVIADAGTIQPVVPARASRPSEPPPSMGPAPSTAIGSLSAAERQALDRVTPANRATFVETVPSLVPATTMDEGAKRPSQQAEQNFARALVLPDAPPAAAFPAGEDSGEMLVAPGAARADEPKEDRKSKRGEAASEKAASEKAASEKAASEKAASEKAASEKAAEPEKKREKKPVLPEAPDGPRRWPWLVLVIVLLAVGAGAYVYFFGFDLPQL